MGVECRRVHRGCTPAPSPFPHGAPIHPAHLAASCCCGCCALPQRLLPPTSQLPPTPQRTRFHSQPTQAYHPPDGHHECFRPPHTPQPRLWWKPERMGASSACIRHTRGPLRLRLWVQQTPPWVAAASHAGGPLHTPPPAPRRCARLRSHGAREGGGAPHLQRLR